MTINPNAIYETSWWERAGQTDWEELPSGTRRRRQIFKCTATGETTLKVEMPVGALYVLDREGCKDINSFPHAAPHDGLAIACVCLNGHHWYIDGRASNCTMRDDNAHRCWVRHGTVGERIRVDKDGLTCAAGAGSFYMGPNQEWHGFVRDGRLTPIA